MAMICRNGVRECDGCGNCLVDPKPDFQHYLRECDICGRFMPREDIRCGICGDCLLFGDNFPREALAFIEEENFEKDFFIDFIDFAEIPEAEDLLRGYVRERLREYAIWRAE